MEKETGQVLYAQNEHEALEPASVTKVMTLLLTMEAIEAGSLHYDDVVTVSAASACIGSSTAPACTGVSASTSRSAAHKPAIRLICSPPFRFVSSICGGEIFMPPSTKFPVAKPGDICYNKQVSELQG